MSKKKLYIFFSYNKSCDKKFISIFVNNNNKLKENNFYLNQKLLDNFQLEEIYENINFKIFGINQHLINNDIFFHNLNKLKEKFNLRIMMFIPTNIYQLILNQLKEITFFKLSNNNSNINFIDFLKCEDECYFDLCKSNVSICKCNKNISFNPIIFSPIFIDKIFSNFNLTFSKINNSFKFQNYFDIAKFLDLKKVQIFKLLLNSLFLDKKDTTKLEKVRSKEIKDIVKFTSTVYPEYYKNDFYNIRKKTYFGMYFKRVTFSRVSKLIILKSKYLGVFKSILK